MMEIRNEDEDGSYDHILLGYGGALLWLVSEKLRGLSIYSQSYPFVFLIEHQGISEKDLRK